MKASFLKQVNNSFVLQKDSSDCGIACIQSICSFYNIENLSTEHIRDISGTNSRGTTLLGLSDAMIKLGFGAQPALGNIEILKNHKDPIIVHVVIDEKYEHYVVCYGYQNGIFIIGDPAKGIESWSEEDLNEKWKSKSCLVVTLQNRVNTKSYKQKVTSKKQWLLNSIKEDKSILFSVVGTGLVVAALSLTLSIFFQKLIDNILPNKDLNGLIISAVFLFVILSFKTSLATAKHYFATLFGVRFNKNIIGKFFNNLLQLPFSFFNNRKIGDLVARLNDVLVIERVIKRSLSDIVIHFSIIVSALVVIGYFSIKLLLLCLVFCPIYFYVIYRFSFKIANSQTDVMKNYAFSEARFINTINNISIIKGFNYEKQEKEKIKNAFGSYQNEIFKLGIIELKLVALIESLGLIITLSVLFLAGYLVISDEILIGEFMTLVSIATIMISSIAKFSLSFIPFQEAKIAFERMYDFTLLDHEESGNINIENINSIEFNDVEFKYPGSTNLLSNINLKLSKGRCIGLVGKSGSGKSTIAMLLQRFLTISSGTITVNAEHNLYEINIENWRNFTGVIPQTVTFIDGDIISNICMTTIQSDTRQKVISFCKENGLDEFISQLPQGYDTIIGDGGIELSGGQKQIIGLARALYKKPDLLIMDEPMASMDVNLQKFTIKLLENIKSHTAILLVTHKLDNIDQLLDDVYAIENNTIQKENSTYLMTS